MFVPPASLPRAPSRRASLCSRRTTRFCACEPTPPALVLSHFEARRLLSLRAHASDQLSAHEEPLTIDLGRSSLQLVNIDHDGVSLPPFAHPLLSWQRLQKLSKRNSSGAYEVFPDGSCQKIVAMSELTNRVASLMPVTPSAPPTLLLAGFTMHRVKNVDPAVDTANKIAAIGGVRGRVLDVCTGLGYTAMAAARCADVTQVTTIELDPVVLAIARRNPWSATLFSEPIIQSICADATTVVRTLHDKWFDVIIHDPPARVLGGDLYSLSFYEQLHRVCTRSGVLFHYVGGPNSRESGRLYKGIVERLKQAGFCNIQPREHAYGVLASCY